MNYKQLQDFFMVSITGNHQTDKRSISSLPILVNSFVPGSVLGAAAVVSIFLTSSAVNECLQLAGGRLGGLDSPFFLASLSLIGVTGAIGLIVSLFLGFCLRVHMYQSMAGGLRATLLSALRENSTAGTNFALSPVGSGKAGKYWAKTNKIAPEPSSRSIYSKIPDLSERLGFSAAEKQHFSTAKDQQSRGPGEPSTRYLLRSCDLLQYGIEPRRLPKGKEASSQPSMETPPTRLSRSAVERDSAPVKKRRGTILGRGKGPSTLKRRLTNNLIVTAEESNAVFYSLLQRVFPVLKKEDFVSLAMGFIIRFIARKLSLDTHFVTYWNMFVDRVLLFVRCFLLFFPFVSFLSGLPSR